MAALKPPLDAKRRQPESAHKFPSIRPTRSALKAKMDTVNSFNQVYRRGHIMTQESNNVDIHAHPQLINAYYRGSVYAKVKTLEPLAFPITTGFIN